MKRPSILLINSAFSNSKSISNKTIAIRNALIALFQVDRYDRSQIWLLALKFSHNRANKASSSKNKTLDGIWSSQDSRRCGLLLDWRV